MSSVEATGDGYAEDLLAGLDEQAYGGCQAARLSAMEGSGELTVWGVIPVRIIAILIGAFGVVMPFLVPFIVPQQGATFWELDVGTQVGIVAFFALFGALPGCWFLLNGLRSVLIDADGVHARLVVWRYRTVGWEQIEDVHLSSRGICAYPRLALRDTARDYKLLGCLGLVGAHDSSAVMAARCIRDKISGPTD